MRQKILQNFNPHHDHREHANDVKHAQTSGRHHYQGASLVEEWR